MKKGFLAAALALAMVAGAQAQTNLAHTPPNIRGTVAASETVNVLTTVIRQLTISADQDIDFGFVTANPSGGAAATYTPINSATFTISGEPSSTVSVTPSVAASGSLTLTGGTGTVTWSPNAVASSTALGTGGNATVNVGGTLTVGAGASGNFGGTYTIDVAYTAI